MLDNEYKQRNIFAVFFSQSGVMLRRNVRLQLRYWTSTLAQAILAPLLFLVILYVLQQADYYNQRLSNDHPPVGALPGVSPCYVRHQLNHLPSSAIRNPA
jgi:hypothetical protein